MSQSGNEDEPQPLPLPPADQPELGPTPATPADQPELGPTMGGGVDQTPELPTEVVVSPVPEASEVQEVPDSKTSPGELTKTSESDPAPFHPEPQPQEAETVTATSPETAEVQNQGMPPPETESAQKHAPPSCVSGDGIGPGEKLVPQSQSAVLEEATEPANTAGGAEAQPPNQASTDPEVEALQAMASKSEHVCLLDRVNALQTKLVDGETGDDEEKTKKNMIDKTSIETETQTGNIEEALDRSIEEHGGPSLTLKAVQPIESEQMVPPKVDLSKGVPTPKPKAKTPAGKAKAKAKTSPASVARAASARLSASGSGMGRGRQRASAKKGQKNKDYFWKSVIICFGGSVIM